MVQTRSQRVGDSPRKVSSNKTSRKKRVKRESESSSDEESRYEPGDEEMPPVANLGTILEENEEVELKDISVSITRLEKVHPNLNMKNLQITKDTHTGKPPKSLTPILEEGDSSVDSDLNSNEQDQGEEVMKTEQKKTIRKHRFYFPPAKTLIPPNITPTSIDAGMDIKDTYIDVKSARIGKKKIQDLYSMPTISSRDSQLKDSIITPDFETKHAVPAQKSLNQQRKDKKTELESTAGKQWFNFKPPEMTDEIKRDLKILKMRSILDPKRFYKHNDRKTLPKYFQVGRIMDNPVDFYSSRVPKKQRKANLTEELLADAEFKKYQKRKYNEIQIRNKARGGKRRKIKHGKFSKKKRENAS